MVSTFTVQFTVGRDRYIHEQTFPIADLSAAVTWAVERAAKGQLTIREVFGNPEYCDLFEDQYAARRAALPATTPCEIPWAEGGKFCKTPCAKCGIDA